MFKGLAIVTRFFDNRLGSSPAKIVAFAQKYSLLAETVIVTVNVDEDKSGSMEALKATGIANLVVIGVTPWGKFVNAMNTLLREAALRGMDYMLSCSTEVAISEDAISILMNNMDAQTLCAGARLPEHEFLGGKTVDASGTQIPWNTACLWNLKKFSLVGFPLAGDAPFDPTGKLSGVEELTAIAMMQQLYGIGKAAAKLVEVPGIEWHTEFGDDPARKVKHLQKLASKRERPAEQLRRLELLTPLVQHIALSK